MYGLGAVWCTASRVATVNDDGAARRVAMVNPGHPSHANFDGW